MYLGNELEIEGTSDLKGPADSTADEFDLIQGLLVQVLGWGDQRGISRVNARILHMFRHCHTQYFPFLSHCIHIYLLQYTAGGNDDRLIHIDG